MYVQNCWYVAAWSDELAGDGLISRFVAELPIAFYRKADGSIAAMLDQCPHRYLPLSMGRREGDDIRCMYHGIRFSSGGKCLEVPGQNFAPASMAVRRFATVERHSWIWVWLGDPDAADESVLPFAVGLDDPGYLLRKDSIDYAADYQLINDNLTDFSHLAFVHESTIGVGSKHAEKQAEVEALPRGVGISRWHRNVPNSRPYIAAERIDLWSAYEYLVPGVMFKVAKTYLPGAADFYTDREPDDRLPTLHANVTSQAVTPTRKGHSRYFFSIGPRVDEPDAAGLADQMFRLVKSAFEEDRVTIEAQQRSMIDLPPPDRRLSILHDKGPVLMRRAIETLIAAESGAARTAAEAEPARVSAAVG